MDSFDCRFVELVGNDTMVRLTVETARGLLYFSFVIGRPEWMCCIPRDTRTVMRLIFDAEGYFKKFSIVELRPGEYNGLLVVPTEIINRARMVSSNCDGYYYLYDRIRREYPTSVYGEMVNGVMNPQKGEFLVQRALVLPLNPYALVGPEVNSPVYKNVFDVILPMPIAEEIKEYMPVIPYILS